MGGGSQSMGYGVWEIEDKRGVFEMDDGRGV